MKHSKLKVLGFAAATLLALPTLTGCGGGEFSYALPEVTVTDEMLETLKNTETTISFWHSFGATVTSVLDSSMTAFMEKYPYIKVEYESKSGYDNLKEAISLATATDSVPNVAIGYPDHFAEYVTSEIQVPLDKYMSFENPEIGISNYTYNPNGASATEGEVTVDLTDFYDNYMKENQNLVDGNTTGLPFNKSTEVMIFNDTLLSLLGLENEPKSTWEEIYTLCGKIRSGMEKYYGTKQSVTVNGETKELDFSGVTADNFRPMSYDSQANFFITIARQWGGAYTEVGDSLFDGHIVFDNEQVRTALTFVKDMYDKQYLGIPAFWEQSSYCTTPFQTLKCAMGVSSSAGAYNNVASSGEYKLGICEIPYHEGGTKTVIQQGTNIAMLTNTNTTDEERLASWLLIRFLTGEANVAFAQAASYLPVRKSGVASNTYQTLITGSSSNPLTQSKIDSPKIASGYNDNGWVMFTDDPFVGSSQVRNEVDNLIPGITVAGKSIDDELREIYGNLAKYVKN